MRPRTLIVVGIPVVLLAGAILTVVAIGPGNWPRKTVKVELHEPNGPLGGCKINKVTERLKAGDDDDVVEWEIKNKCSSPQQVVLDTFNFIGKVPSSNADGGCQSFDPENEQKCPIEGEADATCRASQWVKPKQGNDDGKAKIARAANTRASDYACYKYYIRIGGDSWDPEWVIWR